MDLYSIGVGFFDTQTNSYRVSLGDTIASPGAPIDKVYQKSFDYFSEKYPEPRYRELTVVVNKIPLERIRRCFR